MVGGNAFAGVEVHRGKAQGQPVEAFHVARLTEGAIPELNALGVDIQAPAAGARTARHHCARGLGGAQPDQIGGVQGRHVVGVAGAVQRRSGQHQVAQQRFAGQRVIGVEAGVAIQVEPVARRQLQGFQGRGAELRVAAQQAVEQCLVQGQTGRQAVAGGRRGQGFDAAQVDGAHAQVEVTGAIAHLVAQLERAVGQGHDTALGVQPGLADARLGSAGADVDPLADHTARPRGADHVEQAVGHPEHIGDLINKPVAGIVAGLTPAQGVEGGALLHHDGAGVADQEHFRRRQGGTGPHSDVAVGGIHPAGQADEVTRLTVIHHRHAADHQPCGTDSIEGVGSEANAAETGGGRRLRRHHLDTQPALVEHRDRTAVAAGGGVKAPDTVE